MDNKKQTNESPKTYFTPPNHLRTKEQIKSEYQPGDVPTTWSGVPEMYDVLVERIRDLNHIKETLGSYLPKVEGFFANLEEQPPTEVTKFATELDNSLSQQVHLLKIIKSDLHEAGSGGVPTQSTKEEDNVEKVISTGVAEKDLKALLDQTQELIDFFSGKDALAVPILKLIEMKTIIRNMLNTFPLGGGAVKRKRKSISKKIKRKSKTMRRQQRRGTPRRSRAARRQQRRGSRTMTRQQRRGTRIIKRKQKKVRRTNKRKNRRSPHRK